MNRLKPVFFLGLICLAGCDRPHAAGPGITPQTTPDRSLPGPRTDSANSLPPSALSGRESAATPRPGPEFHSKNPDVERLVQSFSKGSPTAQEESVRALLEIGTMEALDGLVHLLGSLRPGELKTRTCQELSHLDTRDDRDTLLALMSLADQETRRALAIALGAQADSGLVLRMVEQFDAASHDQARQNARLVMSAIRAPEAMETLAAVLTDPNNGMSDPIVAAAAEALAMSGGAPQVNVLLRKMQSSGTPEEAKAIADLVAGISNPVAESALIYAARGNKEATTPTVRLAAVRALENFPGQESLGVLKQLQQDPNPEIQAAAAKARKKIETVLGL